MKAIGETARKKGYEYYTSCPRGRSMNDDGDPYHIFFGSIISRNIHIILGKITGLSGFFSVVDTIRFIKKISSLQPDIIHIHNLHESYINIPLLFRYIKKNKIKVVWTLHDCWAFTGRCPHFEGLNCTKWKEGCSHCPYPLKEYPTALYDTSRFMWKVKKSIFTGIEHAVIVTPSEWLNRIVKESFLNSYKVKTINNGIDISIFHPMESNFRDRYNIESEKKIILGVASTWTRKKGIDVFILLSKMLKNDYKVVLVGTNSTIDELLPGSILSIHRTESQTALAEIYSAADVFVNPTREDTFPTTNIEALACGTPVVTFNVGGSPEVIDNDCGMVVEVEDIDGLLNDIYVICEGNNISSRLCVEKAHRYNKYDKFNDYIINYDSLMDYRG